MVNDLTEVLRPANSDLSRISAPDSRCFLPPLALALQHFTVGSGSSNEDHSCDNACCNDFLRVKYLFFFEHFFRLF